MFERPTAIAFSITLGFASVATSWGDTPNSFAVSNPATLPVTASSAIPSAASPHPVSSIVQPFRTIQLHGLPSDRVPVVSTVAIQPRGELLATAGDDHIVRLWNVETGLLTEELKGHQDWVTALAFTADGTRLVSGCRSGQVLVWRAKDGSLVRRLETQDRPVAAITCSDAQDLVAIVGFRSPLKLYHLKNGSLVRTLPCPCVDMRAITFSTDGRYLAGGGRNGRIRIWDLEQQTSTDLAGHQRRVRAVAFSESGDRFISAGEDQRILIWPLDSPPSRRTADAQGGSAPVSAVSPLPNIGEATELNDSGKILSLALVNKNTLCTATSENVIRIWDLRSGKTVQTLQGHTGSIASLVVENDSLVSGSFDTTVRVWKLLEPQSP